MTRWPRLLRLMVAGSFGVNLFMLAALGTLAWKFRHGAPLLALLLSHPMESSRRIDRFRDSAEHGISLTLPPADRPAFTAAVSTHNADIIDAQRAVAAAFEQTRRDIAREPYSDALIDRDLQSVSSARREAGDALGHALRDALGAISPQGRAAIAHYHLFVQ